MKRTCTKCFEEKDIKMFYKASKGVDGYKPQCKACEKKYYDEYRKINGIQMNRKMKERTDACGYIRRNVSCVSDDHTMTREEFLKWYNRTSLSRYDKRIAI